MLLDLHLDRLDGDDRAWLTAELRRDAELRSANDRLCRVLQPLDQWTVPQTPPNFADRIIRHIEQSRSEFQDSASAFAGSGFGVSGKGRPPIIALVGMDEPATPDRDAGMRGFFFSMREILAAAACILLLFSVLVPGVRSRSEQAVCRSRMHSIGQGVSMYQDVSMASLPFAGSLSRAPWLPSARPDRQRDFQSNSRHSYLVLRLGLVDSPQAFVCPSSVNARAMNPSVIPSRNDFDGAFNTSYDSLNMAGDTPPTRPQKPLVYLSDRSPLFVNGRFNAEIDPATTNSPNHGGKGQNVLRLDGSAEWVTTPVYGPDKDNLWLESDRRRYDGTETIEHPDEIFLIPGFPDGEESARTTGLSKT
jgi:hypothetical protein